MADLKRTPDVELERALREVGRRYPYPPTPNLASRVRGRISTQPVAPRRSIDLWRDPRRLALVAAALLVLLGAAALANPTTRDAIAHFFHVRGVIVNRVPSPAPSVSSPTPIYLGRLVTLEEAQSAVKFTIVIPPALGNPDGVYLGSGPPGGEVALAYLPRPGMPLVKQTGLGLLVTEFRGDLIPDFITKEVGPGTTLDQTSVHGDPGWWIAGEPHTIVIQSSPDGGRPEVLRLAANTLIWEHSGVTYRIESALSRAETLRLAAGLP